MKPWLASTMKMPVPEATRSAARDLSMTRMQAGMPVP